MWGVGRLGQRVRERGRVHRDLLGKWVDGSHPIRNAHSCSVWSAAGSLVETLSSGREPETVVSYIGRGRGLFKSRPSWCLPSASPRLRSAPAGGQAVVVV